MLTCTCRLSPVRQLNPTHGYNWWLLTGFNGIKPCTTCRCNLLTLVLRRSQNRSDSHDSENTNLCHTSILSDPVYQIRCTAFYSYTLLTMVKRMCKQISAIPLQPRSSTQRYADLMTFAETSSLATSSHLGVQCSTRWTCFHDVLK
jgi:hypothetical protein